MDRSRRRHYIWGGIVALIFFAVNVGVAVDQFRIQGLNYKETVGSLDEIKQLAEQRATLLTARTDNGPIDLQMMKKVGVVVSNLFVLKEQFASPWGRSLIMKDSSRLIWDFYDITTTGCMQLLHEGATIPGIVRVATSATAADEKSIPLTDTVVVNECRRNPLMVRIILE